MIFLVQVKHASSLELLLMRQPIDIHFSNALFRLRLSVKELCSCLRHGRDVWHFAAGSQCMAEGANELRRELNKAEKDYILKTNRITAMKENTKQFWCYMKRLGYGENRVADLLVNITIM